ncbi:hypothetical protein [Calothrix sp. NIES-2100]|uniref:hypothetical protein n=1 Tax=Calothrix sp. NIES-2100 TaxID=1954172 RepID=UPI0030DB6E4A
MKDAYGAKKPEKESLTGRRSLYIPKYMESRDILTPKNIKAVLPVFSDRLHIQFCYSIIQLT